MAWYKLRKIRYQSHYKECPTNTRNRIHQSDWRQVADCLKIAYRHEETHEGAEIRPLYGSKHIRTIADASMMYMT